MTDAVHKVGPFETGKTAVGDSLELISQLPDESIDVVVTSPPYWGQRMSNGVGVEADPRQYVAALSQVFGTLIPKMKPAGIVWINPAGSPSCRELTESVLSDLTAVVPK